MSKKAQLVLGATSIEVTQEPVALNLKNLITKHEIVGVTPIYNVKPITAEDAPWWIYPYLTMTIINIDLSNGLKYSFELQDITNQPTWNLGTKAAIDQAISDINAWL